jgi:hypothetical protein
MGEAHAGVDASTLIIVRTGAMDRFAALREAFSPDGVGVVWDRRGGDRRSGTAPQPVPERRRRERRGTAPASWDLLDFLVVPTVPAWPVAS